MNITEQIESWQNYISKFAERLQNLNDSEFHYSVSIIIRQELDEELNTIRKIAKEMKEAIASLDKEAK